jgi:predicted dehydrogenase
MPINRREFLQSSTLAAAAFSVHVHAANQPAQSPSELVNCGVMGLGRGLVHAQRIVESTKHARLLYLCDVDQKRLDSGMKSIEAQNKEVKPKLVQDFRRMLDDPSLDAVFIATCNHWHAPATILACKAGKHVYVEKPGSHNAREGELMVEAARKHKRVVQLGNQRRTWPAIREAIEKLHSGAIGKVRYARCNYASDRGPIGKGKPAPVPEGLDWPLWQGPAPDREYLDNIVHYNWHWRWHWGGGELANNGPHAIDIARWGLKVDYPLRISHVAGRYRFDDDQETPDTGVVTYDFGHCGLSWDYSSCHARRDQKPPMVHFSGDDGSLHIYDSASYQFFDRQGKPTEKGSSEGGEGDHIRNFLTCVRTGETPNSEIEIGQRSVLLCHLGNIAYRVNRVITFDPEARKIVGDEDAMKLWSREYRPGFEPTV